MNNSCLGRVAVAALLTAAGFTPTARAAAPATPAAVPQIAGAVDDSSAISLDYDAPLTRHEVQDKGALAGGAMLEHLQLVMKRPAERQAALDKLVAEQLDPASPNFRKWVEPQEFGAAFGPAKSDVEATVRWLETHGFKVEAVSPNLMSIDFTGTVGQVSGAFRTELHDVLAADGAHHMANMAAPSIPAALAGAVHGVTLSNFFPKPALEKVGQIRRDGQSGKTTILKADPQFTLPTTSGTFLAVAPQDFSTIYNLTTAQQGSPNIFNPATGAPFFPVTGAGVTVIVAEQTDIKASDWTTFRKAFGLSGFAGTLKMVHPGGCADPGFTPDESEAALDAEWSSAVAPDATIIEASCAGTATTFGVMTTLQNLVNVGPRGAAISISYGGCEAGNGLSFLTMWTNLVEQAAAEGISVFVSSGDNVVADCDNPGSAAAKGGLAVNGLASNPYDTVAGGTDFSDTVDGTTGQYWAAKNDSVYGSALSYIPEIPWDNSCASSVLWKFEGAPNGIVYCNTPGNFSQGIVGGSGGKSEYYSKPDWQPLSLRGVPNDGARDLPDVSLFAANGLYNHFYVYCMSDKKQGGVPCNYNNASDVLSLAAGGTSFVAPILAGIQGLVVQLKGYNVGNAAPRYYQLAQLQYSNNFLASKCLSNKGTNEPSTCVFNEITRGDNAAACAAGSPNCFTDAQSVNGFGILSSSKTSEKDAYPATLGYNLATGLGSVNITNLLINY